MKTVFILSISSDIGKNLAKEYLSRGWEVYGTYRNPSALLKLSIELPGAVLHQCDISIPNSIQESLSNLPNALNWDIFISLPCNPLPLSSFFESSINQWVESFMINSLRQLEFLHGIYPYRNKESTVPTIVFTAGGGTNNAVEDFSAYTSAKIHLIKMMELLALEDQDSKYIIIGPGWTNTKTHLITLQNTSINSKKHNEVASFLANPSKGTTYDEIIRCLDWIYLQPREIVSGRNFSVVHDNWEGEISKNLISLLSEDKNMYKLRRHGNSAMEHRER
jgi:NAD(P)-dependent dehydrogenase (short-subunit alcohol dehydrogenase family)